jgi:hypothetical protein
LGYLSAAIPGTGTLSDEGFVMDPEAGIREPVFRPRDSMYFETSGETRIRM